LVREKGKEMSKFIVVTPNAVGEMVPLRGSVWAFSMERAQVFETKEAAEAALLKAKKFMKAKTFKAAKIIPHGG
jgi:hypothetical protein